eukprot:5448939-Amphidinium_carterae.1
MSIACKRKDAPRQNMRSLNLLHVPAIRLGICRARVGPAGVGDHSFEVRMLPLGCSLRRNADQGSKQSYDKNTQVVGRSSELIA